MTWADLHPVDHDDFETITVLINGTPRQPTWQPLAMELIREDEKGRPYLRSDAPDLGASETLIFRPTVILAMGQLLRSHGELLPLRCEGNELWMFNPCLLDALDEEASTIPRWFAASTRSRSRNSQEPARRSSASSSWTSGTPLS